MNHHNPTISEAYRKEQERLHANPRYGVASLAFAPLVRSLLRIGDCRSLADYGAGKCKLASALGLKPGGRIDYRPYDPAFPVYGAPRPGDLLTCIDVLEHVEPHLLDGLLDELSGLARRLVLLTVHTGPAKKVLSDGRNAHLIQQPPSWWVERFAPRFDLLHLQAIPKGFFVIATAKGGYDELRRSIRLEAISDAAARARPRRRWSLRRLLRRT